MTGDTRSAGDAVDPDGASTGTAERPDAEHRSDGHQLRDTFFTLFLDAGLSVATYLGLHWAGFGDYTALLAATVVAGLRAVYVIVRRREVDAFSIFMLFTFALGLGLSFLTGSPRFLLVKESFGTAASGLVFLVTCLVGKPLMYYASQRFSAPTAQERAEWSELWQVSAGFRRMFVRMSVVWGSAFLLEAALRIPLVFVLPVPVMAVVSPILTPVLVTLLVAWSIRYGARSEQRLRAGTSGSDD